MLREQYNEIAQRLIAAGLRPTRQRLLLGHLILVNGHRHMTAEALHRESKALNSQVSLATVYNTLHQFRACGLLKEVVVDGGRAYFDTNIDVHHHFYTPETGELVDVHDDHIKILSLPQLPEGMAVDEISVMIRLKRAA